MHKGTLEFSVKDFFLLSIEMIKFKETLPHPASSLYIQELIKQFHPEKVYAKMRENIRT